jgi:hypothetical protein
MVLLCTVHEDGKPRLTPRGSPEIRFMLPPSGECEIIDTWTVGGLRGTGSHDVAVRDVFVPSSYGSGFTDPYVLPELRYRIPPFSRVIPGLGAMALGIARTAIDTLIEIAIDKTPERTTQRLQENHGIQIRVSQTESLVRSARLFLFDSLDRLWTIVTATGEAPMEARWRRSRRQRGSGGRPDVRCRRSNRAVYELPAPTRVSRRARDHAAHRGSSAGDGNDRPSFTRARTGHPTPLTAESQVFSVVR